MNDANSLPLVTDTFDRLPGSGMAVPVGSSTLVYQDSTNALVLLNTTTGKPIFRYEIGNIIVRSFAKLNDSQFLSFHADGKIYLWKSKPATADKEPLRVFQHDLENSPNFTNGLYDSRARFLVIDDQTFVSVYIKYAHAFNTLNDKKLSARVGVAETVTTIAPGRVLIPNRTISSGSIVDQVWDVKTGVITNNSRTTAYGDTFLYLGHGQTLVRTFTETYIKDFIAGNRLATLPFSYGASMISSQKMLLHLGGRDLSIYDTKDWKKLLDLYSAAISIGQVSSLQGDYFAIASAGGIEIRNWKEPEKTSRLVNINIQDRFRISGITNLATTTEGDAIIQNNAKTVILSPWGQIAKSLTPTIF